MAESPKIITIDREKIKPGDQAFIEIPLDRLPSGNHINLPVHIFRSRLDGPIVMFSGGLHGDEVNGIEIVRRIVENKHIRKPICGTVIAMPIINVYGFLNFSRDVPDGKDVNRSFPGNPDGSLASFLAYTLTNRILPLIDFGVDFHTGGASRTNFPQIRHAKEDLCAAKVAEDFAAPFTLYSNPVDGSIRQTAAKMGKSIVVYEGGESLRFDEKAIQEGYNGALRLLKSVGMIRIAPKPPVHRVLLKSSSWVRADTSGLFHAIKTSGEKVAKGEVIGYLNNPFGDYQVQVEAHLDGYIIGHNNIPVVHKGDALFHIGVERETETKVSENGHKELRV